MGWSPLWDKLVMSSIWSESKEVKILWITLLALKNRYGEVKGSLVGLANSARLTVPETGSAMEVLLNPDPYSSSKAFEGRRVEVIPGGWKVLNHDLYREMIQTEYRKEYNRVKQAEYRAGKKTKGAPAAGEIGLERMRQNGASEPDMERYNDSITQEIMDNLKEKD